MAKRLVRKIEKGQLSPELQALIAERKKMRAEYEDKPVVIYENEADNTISYSTRFPVFNRLLGGGLRAGGIVEIFGMEDSGKAQPLDAKVLTPSGFVPIGSIVVGDIVIGSDGRPTTVTGVFPQGEKEVFVVKMTDGSQTRCCGDHLWMTTTPEGDCGVRSLNEITKTLFRKNGNPSSYKNRKAYPNHRVPLVSPVYFHDFSDVLVLDPYLLGLLIGDGSLSSGSVVFNNPEYDLRDRCCALLPDGDMGVVFENGCGGVRIRTKENTNDKSLTKIAISDLGLDVLSTEKFIPRQYLFSDVDSRIKLLQGLCDTDGSVEGLRIEFSTSSSQLSEDFIFLARSLGGLVTTSSRIPKYTYRGNVRTGTRSHRVYVRFQNGVCPISSAKHLARWVKPQNIRHRAIIDIIPDGTDDCVCISVDAKDGLYVTDDFIVTHNTSFALTLAADVQRQAPDGKNHVVMVNFEKVWDYKWWRALGINTSDEYFTHLKPKTLESGMAKVYKLVMTGAVCCVIIDSIYSAPAGARGAMMDKWGDPNKTGTALGVEAVRWGEAWTTLTGPFQDHDVVVLAVNQMREVIDTSHKPRKGFHGVPTTTPRGKALKFYSWVRLKLQGGFLNDRPGEDGKSVKIRVVKNKTSDDLRGACEYALIRGKGFDLRGDLIQLALDSGAVKSKGAWFYVGSKIKVQGRNGLIEKIDSSPKLKKALETYVDRYLARLPLEAFEVDDGDDE